MKDKNVSSKEFNSEFQKQKELIAGLLRVADDYLEAVTEAGLSRHDMTSEYRLACIARALEFAQRVTGHGE